jgi:hypothetical protein
MLEVQAQSVLRTVLSMKALREASYLHLSSLWCLLAVLGMP